jgi:hypothetical protein
MSLRLVTVDENAPSAVECPSFDGLDAARQGAFGAVKPWAILIAERAGGTDKRHEKIVI